MLISTYSPVNNKRMFFTNIRQTSLPKEKKKKLRITTDEKCLMSFYTPPKNEISYQNFVIKLRKKEELSRAEKNILNSFLLSPTILKPKKKISLNPLKKKKISVKSFPKIAKKNGSVTIFRDENSFEENNSIQQMKKLSSSLSNCLLKEIVQKNINENTNGFNNTTCTKGFKLKKITRNLKYINPLSTFLQSLVK